MTNIDDIYKQVARIVIEEFECFGFKRSGSSAIKSQERVVSAIRFQKSTSSTSEFVKFTINISISFVGLERRGGVIDDPDVSSRIGHIVGRKDDIWWTVLRTDSPSEVAKRILDDTKANILLYLEKYENPNVVYCEWKEGRSPGLTAKQCQDRLERMRLLINGIFTKGAEIQ